MEQEQTLVLPLLAFIVPFMTFATPTEDEWRGWVRLWTLELQIPHVLFVRGPWLQGLEKALITGWVLPCELKAALHSLNTCKQLQKKEDMSVEKSNICGIKKEKVTENTLRRAKTLTYRLFVCFELIYLLVLGLELLLLLFNEVQLEEENLTEAVGLCVRVGRGLPDVPPLTLR